MRLATVVTASVLALGAVIAAGRGSTVQTLHLGRGIAWLTNDHRGSVTAMSGPAGRAATEAKLAGADGHDLRVIQVGTTTYVQDLTSGLTSRLDPATASFGPSSPSTASTDVVPAAGTTYFIDTATGTVASLDPVTLKPLHAVIRLNHSVAQSVADNTGTLWVPVPALGSVVPIGQGVQGTPVEIGHNGDVIQMAAVDGTPLAVDSTQKSVAVVRRSGVTRRFPLPSSAVKNAAELVVTKQDPAGVLALVARDTGTMTVVHTDTGAATTVPGILTPGTKVDQPAIGAGRIFIPDQTHGAVLVYDMTADKLEPQISAAPPGTPVTVSQQDNYVFVNVPNGSQALVVPPGGTPTAVSKYHDPSPHKPKGSAQPSARPKSSQSGHGGQPQPGGTTSQPGPAGPGSGPQSTVTPVATPSTSSPPPSSPPSVSNPPKVFGVPQIVSAVGTGGAVKVTFRYAGPDQPATFAVTAASGSSNTTTTVAGNGRSTYQVSVPVPSCQSVTITVTARGAALPTTSAPQGGVASCPPPGTPSITSMDSGYNWIDFAYADPNAPAGTTYQVIIDGVAWGQPTSGPADTGHISVNAGTTHTVSVQATTSYQGAGSVQATSKTESIPTQDKPANPPPYDTYSNPGATAMLMCRGSPADPTGTVTQTMTVPNGVSAIYQVETQIDLGGPYPVIATMAVSVNGGPAVSAQATTNADTYFNYQGIPVRAGDQLTLTLTFSSSGGSLVDIYYVPSAGGTLTISNSCTAQNQGMTSTSEALRVVVSGWV